MSTMMSKSTHKSTHRSWAMIILALVMVSATAQMVSADAGSQTWYLSYDKAGDSYSPRVMYKGSQDGEVWPVVVGQTVLYGVQNPVIWVANQSAQCDVGFAAEDWTVHLEKPCAVHRTVNVDIGVWNGSFTSYGNGVGHFGTVGAGSDTADFTIGVSQIDVKQGEYLAFEVTNPHPKVPLGIVTKCRSSFVSYPASAPDYPTPELPTLVLVSAGLLMLVGYAYMGRRNK